jgi:hypothetical protein
MNICPCRSNDDGICTTHGGAYNHLLASCQTTEVLLEVREERGRQYARYGDNSDLEDGTGTAWLKPITNLDAASIEQRLRQEYNSHGVTAPSWMHLLREELAEALTETNSKRLREELLQVAALAVSWIEKLDARTAPDPEALDDFSGVPC